MESGEFINLLFLIKIFRSTFSSFSTNSKWAKDPRFKAVEKVRDKEAYFKDFVEQLYKKEKEEKRKERDKVNLDDFNYRELIENLNIIIGKGMFCCSFEGTRIFKTKFCLGCSEEKN